MWVNSELDRGCMGLSAYIAHNGVHSPCFPIETVSLLCRDFLEGCDDEFGRGIREVVTFAICVSSDF